MTYFITILKWVINMSFFDTLILDIILILLPMCLIIILKNYNKNIKNINQDYLIDIANFTTVFLLIKYTNIDSTYNILLINIPFIISLLYKRKTASIILAFLMIVIYFIFGYNLDIVLIEYMIYLLIFIIMGVKNKSYNNILFTFLFIKGFSLTIENFYIVGNNNINTIIKIFISLLVFYIVSLCIIKIINIIEDFVSLNQTLKELEKEKNLKNSLFKITHEVKNPIAVCKGYLSMMNYDDIEKIRKYNEIIESELNRTLDIMDNFSEYTKIKINKEIMDLGCLIEDTIESMKIMFNTHKVDVLYNYDSDDEIFINGDYNRLKQVFVNILKNSCEAIGENGKIEIDLKTNKKYVMISIKDNGPGIKEEELGKIDELFYSSKEKGCGIGVSLSKEIIRLHDGEMKYKSSYGEYTEVIMKFCIYNDLH